MQISYAPETWAVRGAVEHLGGKIERIWLAFGEDDVVGIFDMPDNVAAAAISMAFSAGGACKSVKTTPLLSMEEGMDAMKKAGQCGY